MKYILNIIGIALLSLTGLKAQEVNTASAFHMVEIGVRFMPTFSSFDIKTHSGGTTTGEVTIGYGLGGMLGVNFTNNIGVELDVIYNSLSQKYKDQNLDREINVQYVNIPLMLSLNSGKSNRVNLNLVVGPQIGLNVGSGISSGGSSSSDTLKTVWAVEKNDFGFAYGAGLEFTLNEARTVRLDLGFRGVYGLLNISNTSQTSSTNSYYIVDRANVRTYSGYIGLAISF